MAELDLGSVPDPRDGRWVRFQLGGVLSLLVLSLMSAKRSLRAVEYGSESLEPHVEQELGIHERISDNAIGGLLRRLSAPLVERCLRLGVAAEWRRKGLASRSLPWNVVSIDGKHVGTVAEADLRRLVEDDPGSPMPVEALRVRCATRFPALQLQDGAGGVVGLLRVHNATLVSSAAAVVVAQRPIPGATNEVGAMGDFLRDLFQSYRRSEMLQVVMADAGNTSAGVASLIRELGAHYLLTLAQPHGAIHDEAQRLLGQRTAAQADATAAHKANGAVVEYIVWCEPMERQHRPWPHVQQLVRIQRVVTPCRGEVTVGERYFATSLPPSQATAMHLQQLARDRWRVENETHWTHDAVFDEDEVRTPWTKHPDAMLVVGALRAMAVNILAVLRALSRYADNPEAPKPTWLTPTWRQVIEAIHKLIFAVHLDTQHFDRATEH